MWCSYATLKFVYAIKSGIKILVKKSSAYQVGGFFLILINVQPQQE